MKFASSQFRYKFNNLQDFGRWYKAVDGNEEEPPADLQCPAGSEPKLVPVQPTNGGIFGGGGGYAPPTAAAILPEEPIPEPADILPPEPVNGLNGLALPPGATEPSTLLQPISEPCAPGFIKVNGDCVPDPTAPATVEQPSVLAAPEPTYATPPEQEEKDIYAPAGLASAFHNQADDMEWQCVPKEKGKMKWLLLLAIAGVVIYIASKKKKK